MDCILRVIKGPDTGASCRLQPGVNLVGRSNKAALKLSPQDISWEHVSITRNGDQYVAENLSALGTYVDDARLAGPLKLEPRQQMRLSKDTVVRFEAAEGEGGGLLSGRNGLMLLVVVLLALTGLVVLMTGGSTTQADWEGTYDRIERWAQDQADHRRLNAQVPLLFQDAWRLERTEDYAGSRPQWLRLNLLLSTMNDARFQAATAPEHARLLAQLLAANPAAPQAELSDEQMAAALQQFVARRLSWSTMQSKLSRSSK